MKNTWSSLRRRGNTIRFFFQFTNETFTLASQRYFAWRFAPWRSREHFFFTTRQAILPYFAPTVTFPRPFACISGASVGLLVVEMAEGMIWNLEVKLKNILNFLHCNYVHSKYLYIYSLTFVCIIIFYVPLEIWISEISLIWIYRVFIFIYETY